MVDGLFHWCLMPKAYHRVSDARDLDRVMADGVLLPAACRITPEHVTRMCTRFLVSEAGHINFSQRAAEAIRSAANASFEESRCTGPKVAGAPGGILCADIVAGDVDNVFVSLWD